ncbi:hypothetical protein HPX95_19355 [Bacillus tequilensis]|uniref:hypothetical protein n=1 Tax=Bacillus tequilensis TaxID=227866 RepID=UPI0015776E10|nr:hypothetical protein [Bacillus tequilensis]NTU28296.1 hypothetical protein [Bacillus tequilensis]
MNIEEILKKLEKLAQKVHMLEQSSQEERRPTIFVKMDVQDLNVEKLHLDDLAFHLDHLDVQELSGMLNLGNVFSPQVHPKAESQSRVEKTKKDDIEVKIDGKPVPYTINQGKGV